MNDVTWVIVANGERARLFKTQGIALDLQEIDDLVNTEGHGTGLTDKEAEVLDEGERKEKLKAKFAKRVAEYVEQGRLQQKYHRLIIAAEAKFLGMVRADLSEETRRLIFEQVSEDFSELGVDEIQARLRKA
ncbi:host attachment protein [Burkholderia sp. Ac-20365]|jgi:protein required for attachment to host cells|uniref:host attachment protein n=1 Tax=Burkholderia sp. Ac-20365 TaxID=2703897 RepID=UPI00197BC37C|nr:host attachment protein [Burkholderia sp. Ac-20365]MBN3763659.1 host attachment protein [Burkholderia sp. Ac-20365]